MKSRFISYLDSMLQNMPRIGLGTWKLTGDVCIEAVKIALNIGYRHLDTAVIYGNESEIGQAWKASGVAREDLWLTTKVWIDSFDYQQCLDSVQSSLDRLQTEYLDLVLLHWPSREKNYDHHEALDALMELKRQGKIRYLGVSNFTLAMLEEAVQYTGGQIFAHQVEYHVTLDQAKMKAYCAAHSILLEAYSPLAHGNLKNNPVLEQIAQKHSKTISQIALKWLLDQQNVVVLPKASSRSHLEENFVMDGWSLDQEDLDLIDSLPKNHRYCDIPRLSPKWD